MTHLRTLSLALASAWALAAPAVAAPVLQVGSAVVDVGSTFTIDVSVAGAFDLQAFQFDLSYDSTRLRLLGFGDAGTDFEATANSGFGLLGITGFELPGLVSGVSDAMVGVAAGAGLGEGVIATFLFQDIAPGTVALIASSAFLNFSDQGFELLQGAVTNPVEGQLPEPPSVWLALAALCGLRSGRPLPTSARSIS